MFKLETIIRRAASLYLIIIIGALFASCDDFLDIKPKGKVIITTTDEYREMLTMAYSVVPEDRGLATFRSDELTMDATLSKEDISSFKDIWCWNDVGADASTSSFSWRAYYQVIYEANHVIDNADNMEGGTQDERRQLVGEAYMLRAYMHFLLVNLYGEPYTTLTDPYSAKAVPLKTDNDVYNVLSRSTVGAIYDQIESDIDQAAQYLNVATWEEGYNYRFNTLAPDALRSRLYLYMGKWQQSLEASQRVLSQKSGLSDLSQELPNSYTSVENIVALEQVMTATYVDAAKVNKALFLLYDATDQRRLKYFKQQTASNIQCVKGGSSQYSCSFRVGEMYLNAAEAACRLADYASARSLLLTLTKARYTAEGQAKLEAEVAALQSDSLLSLILLERRKELAMEGHRWFDLRRTTREQLTKTYAGETYTLEQDDERYTLRIPSEAISANPELASDD